MSNKDQEAWREENLELLVRENIPKMIKRNELTKENIHKYIVPYLGNDYSKLNKDIDRNLYLLQNINNIQFIHDFIKSNLIKQVNILQRLINNDQYILDPRDFIPKINEQFNILFVRHGIACHNVIPHDNKILDEVSYYDPELTNKGIERSIELFPILYKKIELYYNSQPYSIIASSLLRTQETAYFMLAKHVNKPINVAPHIAERSQVFTNFSLSKNEQVEILRKIDPEIINFLNRGKDDRELENVTTKSYPEMFYDWANSHLDFFEKGSDGIYRAVVYTHGGYIDTTFKIGVDNNDIVYTSINSKNYKKPNFEYFRVKQIMPEDKTCPTGCRITHC
jgi:broad specificity phosphatase PhoE